MRLETQSDKLIEMTVRDRLEMLDPSLLLVPMPDYSAVDFAVWQDDGLTGWIEVKSRKESADQVARYGGLLLKHRKYVELRTLASLTKLPVFVVFAFESGNGKLLKLDVTKCGNKQIEYTGRRDRGLATDEEPVVLFNWPDDPNPELEVLA